MKPKKNELKYPKHNLKIAMATFLLHVMSLVNAVRIVTPLHAPMGNNEAIVGTMRVQMLSPTVVRVEERGPRGFEDRATFTVVGRDLFEGVTFLFKTLNSVPSMLFVIKIDR